MKYKKNLEINGKDKEDFYGNIQDNQNLNIGNKRKNGKLSWSIKIKLVKMI